MSAPHLALVGLGVLGAAIGRRLLETGHPLTVWNRSAEKARPLVEAGATLADTPAEAARAGDHVMTCVIDTAAVERVVFGPDGVAAGGAAGKLLVDFSTIDPAAARDFAERLRAETGMGWLDAPISGGAPAALEGRMTVMVGGDPAEFETVRPVLETLAGRLTLMGPVGAGLVTKLINQAIAGDLFLVLAEATRLALDAGIDAAKVPQAIAGGRADGYLLQEYMPLMVKQEYTAGGKVSTILKDLELVRGFARSVGTPMPVTSMVTELTRLVAERGYADHDNAAMMKLFED